MRQTAHGRGRDLLSDLPTGIAYWPDSIMV